MIVPALVDQAARERTPSLARRARELGTRPDRRGSILPRGAPLTTALRSTWPDGRTLPARKGSRRGARTRAV